VADDDKKLANVPAIIKQRRRQVSPLPYMSDALWRSIQQNATMGTERLSRILASPNFVKLPIKEQAQLINLANDAMFKATAMAMAMTPRGQLPRDPNAAEADNPEANYLRSTANKALELPELAARPERTDRRRPN
jgi:hypothetical protein